MYIWSLLNQLKIGSESERTKFLELLIAFICSESEQKMGDELASLLEVYHLMQKAGRSATLTLSSKGGYATIAKLVIELNILAIKACSPCFQTNVIVDVVRRREPRQMPEPPRNRLLKPSVLHLLYFPGDAPSAPPDRPLLPPLPAPGIPIPSRRLTTVIRRRANTWTSFNQLDGATEETPTSQP